ncbi:fatty-acyl-CoA synthase [Rhizobiales bacterium GAS188]|nr:fatty-acyl-CoA synthase [Rhizobiales bacterium GAS188]
MVIAEQAQAAGDTPALLSDRECFSFRQLAERANRYARWALDQGLRVDGTICLLMPNRPEYMAIWLGITQVGGVVALLNTNLTNAALAHCIKIADPKHVIVAAELLEAFGQAASHLDGAVPLSVHGATPGMQDDGFTRIDLEIERYGGEELAASERRDVSLSQRALCIYTSGTTGLPKAANVSHHRIMSWSYWFAGMMDARASDRMYNCLPMYHSIGGVVATGSLLVAGGSVVIKEKFSARSFWDDIVAFDCSLFQYIGELCRYLINSPASESVREHRLRLCCGNGLRADVWNGFKERFRIPQILEFYAATEGNFSLYNLEGKPGAIGRIPPFMAHGFPAAIVKFDIETSEPARDEHGFCVRCSRGEVGEAIGKISADGSNPANRFEGYTSSEDTEKKILRNVFAEGDSWLRTGDLMRQDEMGFFYFVDRVGDTFRWKGENVATVEVSEAISSCPGVVEANAYGVAVPGTEGRAGMAALVVDTSFDLVALRAHLTERLADYARPLFLRIGTELEITETFKQKKHNLVREGFDPAIVSDRLYFDHPQLRAYVPLDAALYELIKAGTLRL